MSYEKVKNISHRKEGNRYYVTSTSNNCFPRIYHKWEFMPNDRYSSDEIEKKELYLFYHVLGGDLNLEFCKNQDWKYASNKFFRFCKDKNIDTYELWNLPRKGNQFVIDTLLPYYAIFKMFLEEKKIGKYYLESKLGYITKINKKSFNYTNRLDELPNISNNYKKICNDLCKFNPETKKKYGIFIKKLDNSKINEINKYSVIDKGKGVDIC